ncbi:methyltransferase domain-containing protein [Heliobacillus mobilis]|uniref:Methyltransferase domain-containing protein n=1 Tax=Heliobacterium mobile TaxID=28064 RepID=A0A6I3SBM5_HELMO|nr:class I SAM-dependent methyltransferase [Heliobacterium mobile]MTV47712.1 methyltransferase domain-containing protein [Heliobacterium mobile]
MTYWKQTIDYYEKNGDEFFRTTVGVNMEENYRPFLDLIPPGGSILDAGSGSGRDSLYFMNKGYQVTAIDASPTLVKMSSALTGMDVKLIRFDEIEFEEEFDGIWACASLLHVPRQELSTVLLKLAMALKPSGVLYASFKYGDSEEMKNGRFFNSMDEDSLRKQIKNISPLQVLTTWKTTDVRQDRQSEHWLNAIVQKS